MAATADAGERADNVLPDDLLLMRQTDMGWPGLWSSHRQYPTQHTYGVTVHVQTPVNRGDVVVEH